MEQEKKPVYKKWWFWVIILIIVISGSSDNNSTSDISKTTLTSGNTEQNISTANNNNIEKAKVTVIDFSQMLREDIKIWCDTNKVKCEITEDYSDTIEKGAFVSQSIETNTTIYEGDKITIIYSLGKEPTLGQKNALSKAKDYLAVMAFSYKGLLEQLEFEGFTTEEATYGAENCGADWNEQAAKKAKDYLNTMSFSRNGLIEQLEYEGFTKEQAEYGVKSVGY